MFINNEFIYLIKLLKKMCNNNMNKIIIKDNLDEINDINRCLDNFLLKFIKHDIKLDKTDKDGINLLKLIMKKDKSIPVIMISGHATIQIATESIKLGAYEFLEKPFSSEKIINYVNRALETASLKKEKDLIEDKLFHSFDLIGKSNAISKTKKNFLNLCFNVLKIRHVWFFR